MAKQTIGIGTAANDGTGDPLRDAFDKVNDNFDEVYADDFVTSARIADDSITHALLENRYTEVASITTLTGTVSFDCSTGTIFKLSGDITGAYTIDLSNYKKGQIISIYPIKGNQTLNLDAQGSSTNTFNKIGGVDYEDDGTSNNILQIECVDDSATDPVFFYSLSTYASSSSDI